MMDRLQRRASPLFVTLLFFAFGLLYFFRWGPVVQHVPSTWLAVDDLWSTFNGSVAFVHGKFASVYSIGTGVTSFPGILIALAPVAALSGTFHTSLVEVEKNHHLVAHPQVFQFTGSTTPHGYLLTFGQEQLAPHPQVFQLLAPYELLLSAVALFAFDALAERLGVSGTRRIVLGLAEAALLWNVSVLWGHPEDALALAFGVYALIFATDGRFTGAGWLFGAALAFQPLVIVILPILLAMGGKDRALRLVVRGILPSVAVTVPPLAGAFHDTVHALTTQASYPSRGHPTPWIFLAPKLPKQPGVLPAVGGGPGRAIPVVAAIALGWWARRWRAKPEMLVWAVALALALRCYTESVMDSYYMWPTLAVGLVAAARCSVWRFRFAIAAALFTTVAAQWHLGEFAWWAIDTVGITAVLVASARPEPAPALAPAPTKAERLPGRGQSNASRQGNRKRVQVKKKRSGRR